MVVGSFVVKVVECVVGVGVRIDSSVIECCMFGVIV